MFHILLLFFVSVHVLIVFSNVTEMPQLVVVRDCEYNK